MENLPIQILKTDTGLHINIEGFPDAVKVIRVDGGKAKQLADLALHKWDLEFAADCLSNINNVPEEPRVISQALWRSAVVHFMKCFGHSKARGQLNAKTIFKGNKLALENFAYFTDLRNKHLVHDENSYLQAISGAILNNGTKSYKIEKVVCSNFLAETLGQDKYSNFDLLIKTTLLWVTEKSDTICNELTADLEAESYEDLLARGAIAYKLPRLDEVGKTRKAA